MGFYVSPKKKFAICLSRGMAVTAERSTMNLENNKPSPGQLRGVGNRLDPELILFAPETVEGLAWGYTIIDKTVMPAIYMDGEWTEFIPKGVWIQMIEAWDEVIEKVKSNPEKYKQYLNYPEIKEAIEYN